MLYKYLTKIEKEIIDLLIQGKSNKEIALAINKSQGTIKNYIEVLFVKFEARNRTQLAYLIGKMEIEKL